jgi:hypothetical protein
MPRARLEAYACHLLFRIGMENLAIHVNLCASTLTDIARLSTQRRPLRSFGGALSCYYEKSYIKSK